MHPVTIPIRALPIEPEEGVEFMAMPREMSTFQMPRAPEPGPGSDVAGARNVLLGFLASCDRWLAKGCPADEPPALDLVGLPADTLRVLNETLGEGEVSALSGDGQALRIQETVFSGIWREQHFAHDGTLKHDFLLAAPIPPVLHQLAVVSASPTLRDMPLPLGAMNVPALVSELQDAASRCEAGSPSHVVNLTLLPLSPEDTAHLDALLEGGSVVVLSRGFGNCRISSTALAHTWRVQYFNNMQTLILNTIEVVDFPEVALAADEDLRESRDRLAELVQWMGESLSEA
jgi:hydrogenase-1 operon protein HyaF